jgi:hypothetical protein
LASTPASENRVAVEAVVGAVAAGAALSGEKLATTCPRVGPTLERSFSGIQVVNR